MIAALSSRVAQATKCGQELQTLLFVLLGKVSDLFLASSTKKLARSVTFSYM